MMDYFETSSLNNDTAITNIGLTVSEIATSMISVLIGMAVVGLIAVLMLL